MEGVFGLNYLQLELELLPTVNSFKLAATDVVSFSMLTLFFIFTAFSFTAGDILTGLSRGVGSNSQ